MDTIKLLVKRRDIRPPRMSSGISVREAAIAPQLKILCALGLLEHRLNFYWSLNDRIVAQKLSFFGERRIWIVSPYYEIIP